MEDKRSELKKIIMDTRTLPTLPNVISKLNALSDNDKASVQEMARIVSSDQVLSARILRLANSPSYGFYRVSTISNAMILLGVNVVKSLALSSSIFAIMEKNSVGLWEHSLGVGVAANLLARKLGLPECEEIATAALLHDIGKVIVSLKCSEAAKEILGLTNERQIYTMEAEREVIGTDHAEIGGWLAKSWFLPDKLSEPIAFHHDVDKSLNHRIKTSVVHIADVLIKASDFGNSGDRYVPVIQKIAWDTLKLDEQIMTELVAEIEDKLIEVRNFSLEMLGE
ncbi:MAG: HD family phosphohydrolase [Geobacteraceae bacterium GWC2_55_20]|nr:MAG: HD family phosphohydrolase [Geobacteraceae bacterium GWC2_55_20]OGU20802.1 MAG: HD family phosphohydrolase [Geobacteraceae bacterium GWF2_54_21]HBA72359.1 HD family phosphohydrolase [Geobacter sp.]HCE67429.1 HD family phosphohydrolase [Geobacter sp.]